MARARAKAAPERQVVETPSPAALVAPPEVPLQAQRALAFSERPSPAHEYLRALLIVAIGIHDKLHEG